MRITGRDPSGEGIRVQIETDEDIWHLYNVIEVGDLVTASTTRREEKAADKLRAERAEKKRMTLGVRIEKIEFSEDDLRLKLLGTIETGPQDIGQHHTLILETGDSLTIAKTHWRETQLERLQRQAEHQAEAHGIVPFSAPAADNGQEEAKGHKGRDISHNINQKQGHSQSTVVPEIPGDFF